MENKGFENDAPPDGGSTKGSEKEKEASMQSSVSLEMPKAPADKPYAGMGKEDLLRFSNTPFWNRLRTASLIIFWLGWASLLVAVLVLTVVAPRCAAPPDQTWYQKTVMYQVFVRSFYDSDGDGIGDIKGITSKLDYIEDLNAEAIVLSSFYKSHYGEGDRVSDFGYDVTDHTEIDADYGDMTDFENLIEAAHARDIKVIIDFIPNHTGDRHPWFVGSNTSDPQYENYYVWQDCAPPTFPSDWTSVYDDATTSSAWTVSTTRTTECYLHQFLDTQPELNLRSAQVREELENILRFWLDKDVDGFRVMNARYLFEDSEFRDELGCTVTGSKCFTTQQQENYEIIPTWRAILEEYSADRERIMLIESQGDREVNDTMMYYGTVSGSGAHLPLNFQLTQITAASTGLEVRDLVEELISGKPSFGTADWLTGFQDNNRKISSDDLGEDYAGALAVLTMTLPGTAFIYYGEELGMVDGVTLFDSFNTTDPTGLNRDKYRTPMQWTPTGGFVNGTGDAWIPTNPDTVTKNVEELEANETSILNIYRNLAELHRGDTAFHYGDMEFACVNTEIFSYIRYYDGTDRYLVAVNLASTPQTDVNIKSCSDADMSIPDSGELVILTREDALGRNRKIGDSINLRSVTLAPREAAVFMWPYSR